MVRDLNHISYTFLWKGKDKVTRESTINNYEEGGIKMVDIESLIKSLSLSDTSGAWKNYLEHILKDSGGLMVLKCNYNVKYLQITSTFYLELLKG